MNVAARLKVDGRQWKQSGSQTWLRNVPERDLMNRRACQSSVTVWDTELLVEL